jgi:hypothetical protein
MKLIVARIVGTGGFLIRYSNGHTKYTSLIKEVPRLFLTNHYFFSLKKSRLQISRYRNVSMDPMGTVADPLGTTDL